MSLFWLGLVQGSADHALAVALNVELQPAMYVQSAPAFVVLVYIVKDVPHGLGHIFLMCLKGVQVDL
jgi:hypothetical protein